MCMVLADLVCTVHRTYAYIYLHHNYVLRRHIYILTYIYSHIQHTVLLFCKFTFFVTAHVWFLQTLGCECLLYGTI